jgi:hypothetical protein
MNYTAEGPKQLQLLWWEFPSGHWTALREGCRLGFLIPPSGELALNGKFTPEEREVAGRFIDELKELGVIIAATEELKANRPLFCVDKSYDSDLKRCIASCKGGGQNACMGKDPVYLVQKKTMLWRMYAGGWTGIADASKQFRTFPTHPEERKYLGCIHPVTDEKLVYAGLPMGATNSLPIVCKINNLALQQLCEECELFSGTPEINTWSEALRMGSYERRNGHGRILIGSDGLPAVIIFCIVDDYFIHGPTTKKKCQAAFSAFMSYMLRLGFICQKWKTSPPAQVQKFCGMMWDSHRVPKVVIPDSKVTRALATIEYMLMLDDQGILSRLSATVGGGLLQSLVDATPARQGQTYLRGLYDDVHLTSEKYGRELHYSVMKLIESTWADLRWWIDFLQHNPGNCSPTGSMGNMVVTWGNGSGTGTGGTSETLNQPGRLETWMGTWETHVRHYDCNWRELRTLLHTMERKVAQGEGSRGSTLFYFTDNMVTYYIVHNGSSRSPELHKLI